VGRAGAPGDAPTSIGMATSAATTSAAAATILRG
jgi:hypothetical protein